MAHPITALTEKTSRLVMGFMSGTSVDGIDAVLTEISGFGIRTRVRQIGFVSVPFPPDVRTEILRLAGGGSATAADFCRMSVLLGTLYANAGEQLCRNAGISPDEVDLIGNHGQTFWHIPDPQEYCGYTFRSTFQLGGDQILAERFGCPVVGDFRVRDVAAGGLGAPLVPYTEFLLYRSDTECTGLQNLGGIGNLTILPPGAALSDVSAFDTGPGNMVIDAVVSRITNGCQTYDENGRMASRGRCRPELLRYLMADPFLQRQPPKTTGREYYGPEYMNRLYAKAGELSVSETDLLATVTCFTAETVADAIHRFAPIAPDRLIVGGGGALNRTLMAHLRKLLPGCRVMTNEDLGLDGNAKEAVAFAILANEAIFASPGNVPSVTGALHPAVLGRITL